MKLSYFKDTDSLYIDLSQNPSVDSKVLSDDCVVDFGKEGEPVGFDIQRASEIANFTNFVTRYIPAPTRKEQERSFDGERTSRHHKNKSILGSCLNFEVEKIPIATNLSGETVDTGEYRALVRKDNHKLLAIVGKHYRVVQNSELFGHIDDSLPAALYDVSSASYNIEDTISYGGEFCYRKYVFHDITVPSSKRTESDVRFQIIAQNSFGHAAIKLFVGAIDFFCTNGMVIGTFTSSYKRHTRNLQIADITAHVRSGYESFLHHGKNWLRWQETEVTDSRVSQFIDAIKVNDSIKGRIYDQFREEQKKHGPTLWALYSALTFYASHNSVQFPLRETKSDHAATTLMKRSEAVYHWTQSPEFKKLAA